MCLFLWSFGDVVDVCRPMFACSSAFPQRCTWPSQFGVTVEQLPGEVSDT
jgi:hypothetical protein